MCRGYNEVMMLHQSKEQLFSPFGAKSAAVWLPYDDDFFMAASRTLQPVNAQLINGFTLFTSPQSAFNMMITSIVAVIENYSISFTG